MKILDSSRPASGHHKDGMAVIVVLALLGLILAFLVANSRAIAGLGGELKVIEQRQIRRLNRSTTNAPPPAIITTNSSVRE